ncbi:DNA-directed RNA polymerase I subunit RPA34-like [Sinocyclocheilus rhinocerous]|uniref:DNA-directed RNA polymerase I subunit RPA34-like n=1 Tax=Sinocyclocheilus rhinocerous TaxID=307959 RepID=A0A673I8Y0_9TELE|nr:PREDICTED: DNA-directed RNA polymerase I subunit RPA34-like [Sinocyclocheilus rhinocerous]
MSDSEEEACELRTVKKRVSKYKCPADFVSMPYDSSASVLQDEDGEKELWIIKAPARFDPKCFENLQVPLSGLEMVQSSGATSQIYSVLSSRTAPSDLDLLISKGKHQKPVLCSSGFSGVLKISESYGNCSENQGPVPIPAAPAPSIPAGLRQRFQPFGSSFAAHVQDEVSVVSPTVPKRTSQEPIEGEERKKKKKKKKDKRKEDSEAVFIKEEQTQIVCDQLELSELKEEEPTEERRRKKKKVKKEKERQSEDMVDASLISKMEPLDPSYDDYIDTPGKTKKKKKKSSRHE